jgi:aspartyl-tRNA(Asn)/glutamyl-tRNA(Gln) amidotransferase subunit B
MEEGSLRCDANVSLRPAGSDTLGTKTELKNMNSFRYLERGIQAELARQQRLLEAGEPVVQETLHFDPTPGEHTALRSKEEAHDYRYFPEPDLVPLEATDAMRDAARADLPELPAARAERYEREFALAADDARRLAFNAELAAYFEAALQAGDAEPQPLANWIGELVGRIGSDADPAESQVTPRALATLVTLVEGRTVTRSAAKLVLDHLVAEGGDPAQVIEAEGLGAMGDGDELGALVAAAIAANPDAAEKIRGGADKAIGAIIGHVMRETRGRADGGEVTRLVREQLGLS